MSTVRDLLGEALRRLGTSRAVVEPGQTLGGIPTLDVSDTDLSRVLCLAAGRIGPGPGVELAQGSLRISWGTGRPDLLLRVSSPDELAEVVVALEREHQPAAVRLDLDLDAPASPLEWPPPPRLPAPTLDPDLAVARGVIVAGPGVIRRGRADDLVALARRTGWGVINTWGAKGLLAWSDPAHFGTAGLQARDLVLAGVAEAELVIATGVDAEELPSGGIDATAVLEVDPDHLATLTYRWTSPPRDPPPDQGPLYRSLATVIGPWYEDDSVPANPARLARQLSQARPAHGLVAADAGLPGFWLGRTFPTSALGAVVLPATPTPGFAAAVGLLSALEGRPALAVTDHLDPLAVEVAALSSTLDAALAVQIWSPDGRPLDVDEHARVTREQFRTGGTEVEVGFDTGVEQQLVEIAGPIVAWRSDQQS